MADSSEAPKFNDATKSPTSPKSIIMAVPSEVGKLNEDTAIKLLEARAAEIELKMRKTREETIAMEKRAAEMLEKKRTEALEIERKAKEMMIKAEQIMEEAQRAKEALKQDKERVEFLNMKETQKGTKDSEQMGGKEVSAKPVEEIENANKDSRTLQDQAGDLGLVSTKKVNEKRTETSSPDGASISTSHNIKPSTTSAWLRDKYALFRKDPKGFIGWALSHLNATNVVKIAFTAILPMWGQWTRVQLQRSVSFLKLL